MQWLSVLQACVPILVAIVGIIPTIINNRKKTEASIAQLQKTLDDHIKEDENEKSRNQRYRILRFYDEMCEDRPHSESHFEDILEDIDEYEQYCGKHPDFKNNRGRAAMDYISQTYAKLKQTGGFLIHQNEKGE